jgi:hypothetical protein
MLQSIPGAGAGLSLQRNNGTQVARVRAIKLRKFEPLEY